MTGPRVCHLGRVDYAPTLDAMRAFTEARGPDTADEIWLCEHPPVYTQGVAGRADHVLDPGSIPVIATTRGGQVTYHGPGQLVGYPILNLSPDRRDVRRYVRDLQEVLIRTLADLGIAAERRDGQAFIGVWAGEEKIASLGVHLSRWVTTHGFALNVTTDLSYFAGIVPCGLAGIGITSIEGLTGQRFEVSEIAARVARHFGEVFGRAMVAAPPARQSVSV